MQIFQTFLLRNGKGNPYTLLLYKKLYIILDIIVIHIICICIIDKNCIILHFYTSYHIKENVWGTFHFSFFFLFCSLVRDANLKRPDFFFTLQVTRFFPNLSQIKQLNKQLNKTKNTCEYWDLLELLSAWVGDPRCFYPFLMTIFFSNVVPKVVS